MPAFMHIHGNNSMIKNTNPELLTQELRILAWLFGMPCQESLDEINSLSKQFNWLNESSQELSQLSLEDWQAEHTRLFISGYPTTPCPPFESAYLNGTMEGAAKRTLDRFFEQLQLKATGASADYLGTLLEGLAFLMDTYGFEDQRTQELQKEHLECWVTEFASDLQKHSEIILYKQLAQRLNNIFPIEYH